MTSGILSKGWKEVNLGSVLKRIKTPVDLEPSTMYHEIGIRSHGKGIFYKEERTGESIGEKSVFWVEPDCFILNIVFAWEQAVAKTTTNEKGMIASHRFPMYKPAESKLNLDYLVYYFNSPRGKYLLGLASPGGAGRNKTLGQQEFLNLSIPLPAYNEQCKIVEVLSAWDKAIAQTEELITSKQRLKKGLMQQLLSGKKRFAEFSYKWSVYQIKDVAEVRPPKPKLSDDTLVSFVSMSDVSEDARIIKQTVKKYKDVKQGYTPFKSGDVIVAKITPCFENGKGALANNLQNDVGFGSTEFIVLRSRDNLIDHRYLYFVTLDYAFRQRGVFNMVGSAGQKRVPVSFVENYKFPLPSLKEQIKIASTLETLDIENNLLAQKLFVLKQQKKGLMRKLLTGIMRA